MKIMKPNTSMLVGLAIALLGGAATNALANDEPGPRVSESRYYSAGSGDSATPDRVTTDVFAAGEARQRARGGGKGADRSLDGVFDTPNLEFWFYSADVALFADADRDGYYSGIDLLFDADTVYSRAEVYAVAYLSRAGGEWLEYAETETFVIHGTSANDEFSIVTELLSGYPADDYDILIELYDAWDDTFVAEFGPADSSALSFHPLEDAERDTPISEPRVVVNTTSGGGAADPLLLTAVGLLLLLTFARRRRAVPRQ
jgi:hypothetical protein